MAFPAASVATADAPPARAFEAASGGVAAEAAGAALVGADPEAGGVAAEAAGAPPRLLT
jgi:hypothetical protein